MQTRTIFQNPHSEDAVKACGVVLYSSIGRVVLTPGQSLQPHPPFSLFPGPSFPPSHLCFQRNLLSLSFDVPKLSQVKCDNSNTVPEMAESVPLLERRMETPLCTSLKATISPSGLTNRFPSYFYICEGYPARETSPSHCSSRI